MPPTMPATPSMTPVTTKSASEPSTERAGRFHSGLLSFFQPQHEQGVTAMKPRIHALTRLLPRLGLAATVALFTVSLGCDDDDDGVATDSELEQDTEEAAGDLR